MKRAQLYNLRALIVKERTRGNLADGLKSPRFGPKKPGSCAANPPFPGSGRSFALLAGLIAVLIAVVLAPQAARAQSADRNSLFSTAPAGGLTPNPGIRGNLFTPGDVLAPPRAPLMMPPSAGTMPMVPAGKVALALSARFGKQAPPISGGLVWRVFAAKPDGDGNFHLVKEDKAAVAAAGAAGRRLYRACRFRAGHGGQAGDPARADRA